MIRIPTKYFLTNEKKVKELESLKKAIKNNEIDKEMIPILKKFNKIEGVVTKFCCIGHKNFTRGYLLCGLSEKQFEKLLYECGYDYSLDIYDANKYNCGGTFDDLARVRIYWNNEKEMKFQIKQLMNVLKE